jgi:hypothetical protein
MERQTIPRRGANGADLLMPVLGVNLPATSVRVQVYVGIDPTLIPIRECMFGGEAACLVAQLHDDPGSTVTPSTGALTSDPSYSLHCATVLSISNSRVLVQLFQV